jgi:hypothetical protein
VGGGRRERRGPALALYGALAVASAVTAVILTWRRLFVGMDLRGESFSILVPWRWALGDRPFVQEQDLAQVAGFVMYPFVKLFALVRDYDVTGYVLYMRHLYLLLMIATALVVFLLVRRLVRWELGLLVAAVYVTFIHEATPQLGHDTIALAFLTMGSVLGAWVVVLGRGRGHALASGAAYGIAVSVYPSLAFIVPLFAIFMAFAYGRRAVAMLSEPALLRPPDPAGPPTGRAAWRSVSAWVLGGVVVLAPLGLVVLSFGPRNVLRSWDVTMARAHVLHQLGGAPKAYAVAEGFWDFVTWRPYLILAAVVVYLVFMRWPRAGRALLGLAPVALWLVGQRPGMGAAGFVHVYAVLAVYLFLFIPHERREVGAKLLIWIWAPALVAGAMTAYTGAAGYVNASVGLAPAMMVSGVFLAWGLEATWGRLAAWLPLIVLVAVVGVTFSFQYQFQQGGAARHELTSRFASGPWRGIAVTPERRAFMDGFAADLRDQTEPGDSLVVLYEDSGLYLYWKGPIAANTYWLVQDPKMGGLPQQTISYYRRHRIVPTLAVHLVATEGMSDAALQASCGGLDYPPTLVRPLYAIQRKPAGQSTQDVLAGLPVR